MPKTTIYIVLKNFHMQGIVHSPNSIGKRPKLAAYGQDRELGKILMQNQQLILCAIIMEKITIKVSSNIAKNTINTLCKPFMVDFSTIVNCLVFMVALFQLSIDDQNLAVSIQHKQRST